MPPPFRAEHVGSLIRPRPLLEARQNAKRGLLTEEDLRDLEDEAIGRAVAMQEEIGLPIVTDGEFRRDSWHWDFYKQIGGIEEEDRLVTPPVSPASVFQFTASALHATRRLTLDRPIFADDFEFLKSVANTVPKITIPSPTVLHRRGGPRLVDRTVYPDIEEFWSDLAAVYAAEYAALASLGCNYVQLDDTSFAGLCDPVQRTAMTQAGGDGEQMHLRYIRLVNESLKSKPENMAVALHTCRGNFRGVGFATGGYDFIAEPFFSELAVDAFFLEFDDERSGNFEPLRFVPKDKIVVLGLVSTKRGAMETKDALMGRIDAAAKYVPLDQLCLSPQCGFSSVADANAVGEAEQFAKLRLVVETAREIWG